MAATVARVALVLTLSGALGCAGRGRMTFAERKSADGPGRASIAEGGRSRAAGRSAPYGDSRGSDPRLADARAANSRSNWRDPAADRSVARAAYGGGESPGGDSYRTRGAARAPVTLASNLSAAEPVAITAENFEEVVLNSPVPVLIDCWAPWCGPCRRMGPAVDALATEFEGRAVVAKLDIDACPAIARQYGVTNIPAFLYFQNGEVVDRVVGAVPKAQLGKKLAAVAAGVQPVGGRSEE